MTAEETKFWAQRGQAVAADTSAVELGHRPSTRVSLVRRLGTSPPFGDIPPVNWDEVSKWRMDAFLSQITENFASSPPDKPGAWQFNMPFYV